MSLKTGVIMRLLRFFFLVPITLGVIIFSISNKHSISLFFWPIASSMEISVYLLILGTLTAGFIFGFIFCWTEHLPTWVERRKVQNQNKALQQEIKELKQSPQREQNVQTQHVNFSPPANA